MSDREAFLRAIRAEPGDDTARLVFADWLDEHGEPERAEFIRVQIELEPVRYRIDNPRAVELHKREDELLRAHGDDWLGTDHLLTNPADFGPVCRRGFPDYACLSLDTFLKNGEVLFAAHPTLREVALYGLANRCSELTMSPLLARLDTLEIADWPTEDDAISLSVSPHLDHIKRFKLWLGGEPYFLRELTQQASATWPREIELVQLWGGTAAFRADIVVGLNEAANRVAHEANQRLKREAVRVSRPSERLYPLDGDLGHNDLGYHICAGYLPDGQPAILAGNFGGWHIITINESGRPKNVSTQQHSIRALDGSKPYGDSCLRLVGEFREWMEEEVRFVPGPIMVREGRIEGLSVELWDWRYSSFVTGAPSEYVRVQMGETDWANRGGAVRGWLERGAFILNWGTSHQLDWRGKIHSS